MTARHDVRDPHEVLGMLGRLMQDHYVAADDDGDYRFCFAVVRRWWRFHRVDALAGGRDRDAGEFETLA